MKEFKNLTKNKKEKSVKVGSSVPIEAANLAFYSNEQINPKNNLSVIDISPSIPENKASSVGGIKSFFANELGILEDENGNTIFPTSNITLSDTFIGKEYSTQVLTEQEINSIEFFHYYYVSRFFTAAPSGYSFSGLNDYLNPTTIKFLNIKVVDSKNQEYVDINTGNKKYKILLEPYLTQDNYEEADIPYRIVVGLDASRPVDLKLIYDKVECDSNGIIINQNLRYSETINPRPYFNQIPEESYVVDNSFDKKVFSVKKYNKKYSDIFPNYENPSGYNVYVPKKAISDNRTFEVFNWRLVARSNQSINLELVDYFADLENSTTIKQKTVKAAVLFDSNDTTSLQNIKPYVFYRLQNSPFNFSKFVFENPLASNSEKNTSNYWIVDINTVNSLKDFDIVSFCPTKKLSERAISLISNYVKYENGTIVVDGSSYPSNEPFIAPEIYVNPLPQVAPSVIPEHFYNESNKILDENKNGGWNINSSIFESTELGVYGLRKSSYRTLNSAIGSSKSFIKVGTSESSSSSIGALFEFASEGDALVQGNIIFTSFSFLEYCNSLYSITGLSTVLNTNSGLVAVDEADTNLLAPITEGPFKLLYNTVSFAMYCRSYAGTTLDTRSSLFNYVGDWKSSWVMNQDALLEDEKEQYFVNISLNSSTTKYSRDLTKTYSSTEDLYLKNIYDHLPTYYRDKLAYIDTSLVEYFIEVTNPDVIINDAVKVNDPLATYNIPSSYYLFKLNNGKQKTYAYTNTVSPKINIPDGFGPYVVKEIPAIRSSQTKQLNNLIDPINYFETYPFNLETFYSYQTATDKPLNFSGNYAANIRLHYKGEGQLLLQKKTGTVLVRNSTTGSKGTSTVRPAPTTPGAVSTANCVNISSITEKYTPQGTVSGGSDYQWRAFDYTYDMENGNGPDTYAIGATGQYVEYIQAALKAGGFYRSSVDGYYGPVTMAAASDFQNAMKAHRRVYSTDGRVDSETKALLAHAISNNFFTMNKVLNQRTAPWIRFADAAVTQIGKLSQLNSGNEYKKINYSGSGLGQSVQNLQDYIFFSIPEGAETVKSVTVNFGSWKNVTLVSYGYSSVNHSALLGNINQVESSYLPKFSVNKTPDSSGNIVLEINNKPSNGARHFYIHLRTNGQIGGKFGNAEGYSITSIKCLVEGIASSSGGETPDAVPQTSGTYIAMPSIEKPDSDELAKYYLESSSSLYYDGDELKSNQSGFLLYTVDDAEFWEWDGSEWENKTDYIEQNQISLNIQDNSKTLTLDVYGTVNAVDSGIFSNLNATKNFSARYDTSTVKSKTLSFQTISYNYLDKNYSESVSNYGLSSGSFETSAEVEFDLSNPYYVDLNNSSSVALSSVTTEGGAAFSSPLSAISIAYSQSQNTHSANPIEFTLSTSATYYSGSSVIVTEPKSISDYYLMTNNRLSVPKKESITSLDGVLLLCNYTGQPTGIPTASEITSYFGSSSLDQERDSRFGFVFVRNTLQNRQGFIFGFYDIKQKEFLGEKVSFVDIQTRGISNVYIAVTVFDADGNSENQIDFIGPKVSTTFIPTDVPIKRICPVYSVAFSSSSAIQVGNLGSYIDKKEAWPLSITSGSFTKNISIPIQNRFTDWKSNYLGQNMRATYDTSSAIGVNWSNIFGRGYYDISNEKPIIVSDKQIKLRQAPFLVWPEPSDYSLSKVKVFKPKFKVFTRQSELSSWNEINFSEIRDYNQNSGVIEFKNKVVPLDENLIKVDYVKVSSDLLIHQVDGTPVPLNPFLNSENIKLNQALYVYVVPLKIDRLNIASSSGQNNDISSIPLSYVPLTEYSAKYPFGFTYDQSIFNKNSNKYDPFALPIGIIYFINNPKKKQTRLSDTRLRGGGVKAEYSVLDLENTTLDAISHWDTYPHHGLSYPKGGFIIIKLPDKVKDNFLDINEIYDIIRRNITAGVSFQIQNLSGEPWEI